MKALGVGLGEVGFHDVEVVRLESGAPARRCTAAAASSPPGGACAGGWSP